jgi:hypothetical protein
MSLLSAKYPKTELTQLTWGTRYIASGWTQQKTLPSTVPVLFLWAVCLAIALISLTCVPAINKQGMFPLRIIA